MASICASIEMGLNELGNAPWPWEAPDGQSRTIVTSCRIVDVPRTLTAPLYQRWCHVTTRESERRGMDMENCQRLGGQKSGLGWRQKNCGRKASWVVPFSQSWLADAWLAFIGAH